MKLLVVGTGVIGTLNAISLSGHNEIYHYVRKDKLSDYNNKTIQYDILDERLPESQWKTYGSYIFHCVDRISDNYDLIIVAVNSFQLSDVLTEINTQVPNSSYLLMSLNWNGTEDIDAIINRDQYVIGYASGGGTFQDDANLLWGNIGNDIMLGSVYDEQNDLLKQVETLFLDSQIEPEIPTNILHAIWLHNISSAPFGAALTKHKDVTKMINDKELVKTCFDAMKECYKVCEMRGVNLSNFPETEIYSMPFSALYPAFIENITGEIAQRYTAHSLLAIDEMKSNFRQILKTAEEFNVDIPNMKALDTLF